MTSMNKLGMRMMMIFFMVMLFAFAATQTYAAIEDTENLTLTYRVDEGTIQSSINDSGILLTGLATTSTIPQVVDDEGWLLDITKTILPVKFNDSNNLFDFNNLTSEVVYYALSLTLNNSYGTIDFEQAIDLSSRDFYDLDRFVNISSNYIELNGSALPEFNISARITIEDVSLTAVKILKDGENCDECTIISYASEDVLFTAPGFSIYEATNGSVYPSITLSRAVTIFDASLNITGKPYNESYPENVSIDVGQNGTAEFNYTGSMNFTTTFANLSDTLNDSIGSCDCAGCSVSANGLSCTINLGVSTGTQGEVLLSELNISQYVNNVTFSIGTNYTWMDLNDIFFDQDGDVLVYNYSQPVGINVSITEGVVVLIPDASYIGESTIVFNATDGLNTTYSNNITINVTGDTKAPWWQSMNTNGSGSSVRSDNVSFSVSVFDNVGLANFVFSTNASGSWTNSSVLPLSGTASFANGSAIIDVVGGNFVCGYFTFNDTSGLSNTTDQSCFTTANAVPDILTVELSDLSGGYDNCSGSGCTLTPIAGSNISLGARVEVRDLDRNCESHGGEAWLHLCLNDSSYTECSADAYNYSWNIDAVDRDGDICTYEFSTNKSASDGTVEFFRLPGYYKYFVNVSDENSGITSDPNGSGLWRYNSLAAVNYTENIILGNNSVDTGEWNNGTIGYNMTNFGNVIVDVQWTMTNPTNGVSTWILNGSDVILDDDSNHTFETLGDLPSIYINSSQHYFNWSSGIEVCSNSTCNSDSLNETLTTYWHIRPPSSLSSGIYTSTIEYTLIER